MNEIVVLREAGSDIPQPGHDSCSISGQNPTQSSDASAFRRSRPHSDLRPNYPHIHRLRCTGWQLSDSGCWRIGMSLWDRLELQQ
jgi:hypothetical protein